MLFRYGADPRSITFWDVIHTGNPDIVKMFIERGAGYPVSPGHTLIMPKRHVASWFDATSDEQIAFLDGIRRARLEICKRHLPDGFNIWINVNHAAGQTVLHIHVHVIPR